MMLIHYLMHTICMCGRHVWYDMMILIDKDNVVAINQLPIYFQSLDALLDDSMCVAYFNSFLLRECI